MPPPNFGQALRKSRLATFDGSLGQLYTRRPGHSWGLKRELPRTMRANSVVRVEALDSPQRYTPFVPAGLEARALQLRKEAFTESYMPLPPQGQALTVYDTLSTREFNTLLARVESWRVARRAAGEGPPLGDAAEKLLQAGAIASSNYAGSGSRETTVGRPSGPRYERYTPLTAQETVRPAGAPAPDFTIPGRIIGGSRTAGYNVAIAGTIAHLSMNEVPRNSDFIPIPAYVYRFSIRNIEVRPDGTRIVRVAPADWHMKETRAPAYRAY